MGHLKSTLLTTVAFQHLINLRLKRTDIQVLFPPLTHEKRKNYLMLNATGVSVLHFPVGYNCYKPLCITIRD